MSRNFLKTNIFPDGKAEAMCQKQRITKEREDKAGRRKDR